MGVFKIDKSSFFSTHKRGETFDDIQDYGDMDISKGRFAISDGVTLSSLPRMWAELLVHEFLSIESILDFPPSNIDSLYQIRREEFTKDLTEIQLSRLELLEEEFHVSSATFVGIEIANNMISWRIIGDSCLFLLPDRGKMQCISGIPSETDEQGSIIIKFGNHPDQLHSDGTIHGNWTVGGTKIDSGWVLLMTDAMSSWFVRQHNMGNIPLEKLKAINNINMFEHFVEEECKLGNLKSDDESIMLIRIDREFVDEEINEIGINCSDKKHI